MRGRESSEDAIVLFFFFFVADDVVVSVCGVVIGIHFFLFSSFFFCRSPVFEQPSKEWRRRITLSRSSRARVSLLSCSRELRKQKRGRSGARRKLMMFLHSIAHRSILLNNNKKIPQARPTSPTARPTSSPSTTSAASTT